MSGGADQGEGKGKALYKDAGGLILTDWPMNMIVWSLRDVLFTSTPQLEKKKMYVHGKY